MTARDVADWLATQCGDEEFAETMVMTYLNVNDNSWNGSLVRSDMRRFDVKAFGDWITQIMKEILFSKDSCSAAWWKQEARYVNTEDYADIVTLPEIFKRYMEVNDTYEGFEEYVNSGFMGGMSKEYREVRI